MKTQKATPQPTAAELESHAAHLPAPKPTPTPTAQHTPGPWTVREPNDAPPSVHDLLFDEPIDGRNELATMRNCNPEAYANARLMAASPELLATLESVAELANVNATAGAGELREALESILADARAAIAKAKGGASFMAPAAGGAFTVATALPLP